MGNIRKYNYFVLSNGIRVVLVPIVGLQAVTVEVMVKIGAKYESKKEFGMSHFLEHMAFKGTEKRPSAKIINSEIDGMGANYDAGTGYEETAYSVTTVAEKVPWAIEIISDMLLGSIYPELEVIKEKKVVVEEVKMYKDNPMMGIGVEFIDFALGKSSVGCWNLSGQVEDVEKINRQVMMGFKEKYLNSKEMVVVIAGGLLENETELKVEAEKHFGGYKNKLAVEIPRVEVQWNEKLNMVKKKETEQAHFCLGVKSLPRMDKRRYGLKLLEIIIAGNTSSRLFQRIREDEALAYYIYSIGESFKETGILGIQAGVQIDGLSKAIDIVKEELLRLEDTLNQQELNRSIDYICGRTRLAMDRSDFWSGYVGKRLLLDGELASLEEELDKYKGVKLIDIKKLAADLFTKNAFRTLVISR